MDFNDSWKGHPIFRREDGSFVVTYGGNPFHCPNEGTLAGMYAAITQWVSAEKVTVLVDSNDPAGTVAQPSLAEAMEGAALALKLRRQRAEYSGCVLNGQKWDTEEKDEMRLNSAVTMMADASLGITEVPGWKISDGVYVTLTASLAREAALALMAHYQACFVVEREKTAALEAAACADAEAVQAWLEANLETGWPGGE